MTYFKATDSAERLIKIALGLMKKEREAIVSGAFDTVYDLTDEKIDLLASIEERFADLAAEKKTASTLARQSQLHELVLALSNDAATNQRMLRAAREGVEKARIEITKDVSVSNTTFYAPGGGKIAVGGSMVGTSRKI